MRDRHCLGIRARVNENREPLEQEISALGLVVKIGRIIGPKEGCCEAGSWHMAKVNHSHQHTTFCGDRMLKASFSFVVFDYFVKFRSLKPDKRSKILISQL